jgi:hypothetical protein
MAPTTTARVTIARNGWDMQDLRRLREGVAASARDTGNPPRSSSAGGLSNPGGG